MEKVLKIKIRQPQAHYRIPFSYQRRFTYPVPPFSTVKGLICNLLGIKSDGEENFKRIKEGFSLGIYSRYESLVREYVWLRNLGKEYHLDKFKDLKNRILDFTPQHPGVQSPVTVDVLHNVELIIYIYHRDEMFLKVIEGAFYNPSNRLSPIHLGRSEDWLVFEEIKLIEDFECTSVRKIDYFTWIPEKSFLEDKFVNTESYDEFFEKLTANIFRLPTFYTITSDNKRVFDQFVTVKLYEGGTSPPLKCYVDKSEGLPILLTKLKGDS